MVKREHSKYTIARYQTGEADTFSVVFKTTNEHISHHETEWQANRVIDELEAHDVQKRATFNF